MTKQLLQVLTTLQDREQVFGSLTPLNLQVIKASQKLGDDIKIKVVGFIQQLAQQAKNTNNERRSFESFLDFFLPPDIVKREFSHKQDVWSVGIFSYFLMNGEMPFKKHSFIENARINPEALDSKN